MSITTGIPYNINTLYSSLKYLDFKYLIILSTFCLNIMDITPYHTLTLRVEPKSSWSYTSQALYAVRNSAPPCVCLLVAAKNPWWQSVDTTRIPLAQPNAQSPGRTFRQQELKQKSCKLSTRLSGCLIERRARSRAVRLPLRDDTLIRISLDSSQPHDIINKRSGECAAVINELWRLPNEWRGSVGGGGASLRNSNPAAPNWINELALCWMGQKNGLKLGELIKAFGPQSVHIYPG